MSFGTKATGDDATAAWANLIEDALGDGNPAQGASYVIFYDSSDSEYKARNGKDGTIDANGTGLAAVIQATNDALSNGGKIFLNLEGTHSLTTYLDLSVKVDIQGLGMDVTILSCADNTDGIRINDGGASTIYAGNEISGLTFLTEGNAYAINVDNAWNVTIRKCRFRAKSVDNDYAHIYFENSSHIGKVVDCEFRHLTVYGIQVESNGVTIDHNHFSGNDTATFIYVNGGTGTNIVNNWMEFSSPLGGTYVDLNGATETKVCHNKMGGAYTAASIGVRLRGANTERCVVADNVFSMTSGVVVDIQSGCGSYNNVNNNTIEFNGTNAIHVAANIQDIVGNTIKANSSVSSHTIWVETATYVKVVGNTLYAAAKLTARTGINISGACNYVIVNGNRVKGYNIAINPQIALTGGVITGNELQDCTTYINTPQNVDVCQNNNILVSRETRVYQKTVNYDDTSPVAVCSVADGYAVTDVWVEVTTTFDDGGAALDIGDGVDPDGFLDQLKINLAVAGYYGLNADDRGDYLWDAVNSHTIQKVYTGSDTVDATITKTDGTQGVAIVYVKVTKIGG